MVTWTRLDPAFGRDARSPEWCLVCCTRHPIDGRCPGEVRATGPERHGFKVVVETPQSMEAYGVLVAPAGGTWRARILTYPSALWTVPGGSGVMKFVATTPQVAEEQAIRFIEEYCAARKYLMRNGLELAAVQRPLAVPGPPRTITGLEPRWPRVLPVVYEIGGLEATALHAVTRNVSTAGLFVQTPSPIPGGEDIRLQLKLAAESLFMSGTVVWTRKDGVVGRPPGMGVRLGAPPDSYLRYIRSLPPLSVEGGGQPPGFL